MYEAQSGCVCGWAHIFGKHFLEGVYAELGGIVVDRAHRRQGIGRQLLEACEHWAVQHGYTELRVRSGGTREKHINSTGSSGTKIQNGKRSSTGD
uniref:GNAT family N-acetyltransferase n=1 Tax=Sporolactobacillus inulinus TaxID=2078 RepID=UPI0035A24EB0